MPKVYMTLDKQLFYEYLANFSNKHLPIYIDMPINRNELHIRLIFSWTSKRPNGEFNPMMYAQLVDTTKTVSAGKYILPDLVFDCFEKGVISQYKLYKYLKAWVESANAL